MRAIPFLLLFLLGNCIFPLQAFSSNEPEFSYQPMRGTVTLQSGTLVILETAERKLSTDVTAGQILQFRVRTDVVVKGKVVIATGAIALGRVKSITETTYNSPESMTLEVTSVQAVDGQQVALIGMEQTFTGVFPGEGVTVNTGMMMMANVTNNTEIETGS